MIQAIADAYVALKAAIFEYALLPALYDIGLMAWEEEAAEWLDFALMGAAMSRALYHVERPTVGLLNVGVEEIKGADEVKQAHAWLKDIKGLPIDYRGFVEGDQIGQGVVDVVVVEGFAGNIALKTAEGTARFVTDLLKHAFASSLRSKFGFLISRPATELLRHHLDPNNHNGAVFLGLNGVIVKSHGSANAAGVANAVAVAARLLEESLTERIAADLAELGEVKLRENGAVGAAS